MSDEGDGGGRGVSQHREHRTNIFRTGLHEGSNSASGTRLCGALGPRSFPR